MEMTITRKKLSVKAQATGTLIALISAVALPQLVHVIGKASGIDTSLGEILLPMHLPIILMGLLTGPFSAGIAGLLSPLVSFLLTDMPSSVMLPFMMIELCIYGLCAGLLKDVKIPAITKVLIAQIAGRLLKAGAITIGFYAFETSVNASVILTSIITGLVGIILQLVIIPLVVFKLKEADNE
ncbi:MAG: ECF transporter S component [Oscillospiraceae bacterium]|nr:ECF transporter S component [Ruminococcus sp.]MDE6706798.1 ECF transporter S component [Oscillospiraceae bacterium]